MNNVYAGKGTGNGFLQFANINNSSSSRQQSSKLWAEKTYRAFTDWGADHPYFHAPSSGEYGPYRPDGVGLSIGVNAYGFAGSLSIAVDEMNNFGFYGSVSSSLGYPSVLPSMGGGVSLDLYENTSKNSLLEEIKGTTFDTNLSLGNLGLTYSKPILIKNGEIKGIKGAHKLSIGYSRGYSPYSSGTLGISFGIDRTTKF